MAETSNVTAGKGLKILGAGFGRTGTASLKVALEALGFGPCYHMSEVLLKMETMLPLWEAALDGTLTDWNSIFATYQATTDWNSIFATYQATTDWPDCNYYEELNQLRSDLDKGSSVR